MKLSCLLSMMVVVTIIAGGNALADTWCNSNLPGATFCDDFDRYCVEPPPAPATCGTDATNSDTALRAVWVWTPGDCGGQLKMNSGNNYIGSLPYSATYPQQWDDVLNVGSDLAYHQVTLSNPTIGTSTQNLVLNFAIDTELANKQHYSSAFMELSLDGEHAPTDYVLNPSCYTYCPSNPGPDVQYRMICQQNMPVPGCPPLSTTPRAAVAAGLLAALDNDPCHCASDSQRPQNYHLAFFDGLKWWTLKSGMFGGGGTITPEVVEGDSPPGPGDFSLTTRFQTITLTLDGTNCKVEMTNKWKATSGSGTRYTIYNYAYVPLQYTGPFNALSYGVPKGCLLSGTTYECATPDSDACLQASPGSGGHEIDNIALSGGEVLEYIGACCKNDTSCVDVTQTECLAQDGHWQGYGTTCAATTCCPYPFADADTDGDVDQDDFGALQVCFTGIGGGVPAGCECFNRASSTPEGIDVDDFVQFSYCWTGANVLYSVALPSGCNP